MTIQTAALKKAAPPGPSAFHLASPSFVPTRLYFGPGSSAEFTDILSDMMAEHGCRKVLLLTGAPSRRKAWMNMFDAGVVGYDRLIVRNSISNPTVRSVSEILETARRARVDAVVAVGGGSVLDTGKAIAALANSALTVEKALATKTISETPLPYMAIPTTSGTGSEVTSYATIWDDHAKAKYSLSTKSMYPNVAIVDPLLGATMPAEIVAGTGFDALSHAMESCWSINSSEESIGFGLSAIGLVTASLERVLAARDDADALSNLSLGSLYAGMSIAQGQTTISHAISYPLTARYGIHHGHACGVSVGALLAFNDRVSHEDCQDPRGYGHVRGVLDRIVSALGATDADDAERRIRSLMHRTGLPTFDQLDGIDLDLLARDVIGYDRFGNNPRRMTTEQLIEFLDRLNSPTCG